MFFSGSWNPWTDFDKCGIIYYASDSTPHDNFGGNSSTWGLSAYKICLISKFRIFFFCFCSLYHKTCFGGKHIPRVSFRFKDQLPPFIIQKLLCSKHLKRKPVDSIFTYFLTADKAVITKLDQNVENVKYYRMV